MAATEMEISPAKKMETAVDADDDDVSLCFRSKRKSMANVVHDDDDAAVRRGKRGTKNKETNKKPRSEVMARIEAWFEECEKLPPLSSDEEGELDISGACLVEIDGPLLKERDQREYDYILDFAYSCRQKCKLQGTPARCIGSCYRLTDEDHECAIIAIKEYQNVNKNAKLKLRDLMKAKLGFGGDARHYLTFSAEDEMKGEIKAYQAALTEHFDTHFSGDPRIDGLGSATGRGLTDEDHDCADIAIKEYEKVNKNAKLKLRDLIKANLRFSGGQRHYLTFSAEDEMTGEIIAYQAALTEHFDTHLLGLFRDIVDDKVLAILSVKGTEEDLTADEDEFWRMWEERLAKETKPY